MYIKAVLHLIKQWVNANTCLRLINSQYLRTEVIRVFNQNQTNNKRVCINMIRTRPSFH